MQVQALERAFFLSLTGLALSFYFTLRFLLSHFASQAFSGYEENNR
jgi:hypothetical protein